MPLDLSVIEVNEFQLAQRPKKDEPKWRHIRWDYMEQHEAPCFFANPNKNLFVFVSCGEVKKKDLQEPLKEWEKHLQTARSAQAWLLGCLFFSKQISQKQPGRDHLGEGQTHLGALWSVTEPLPNAGADKPRCSFHVHHARDSEIGGGTFENQSRVLGLVAITGFARRRELS